MKNILKIFSIFLVGLALVLTSCDRNYPFPETERITLLDLQMVEGPTFFQEATPPSTVLRFNLGFTEFGGDEQPESVEFAVVRNDQHVGTIATFTGNFRAYSDETPEEFELTVQQMIELTGGAPLVGGDVFAFFYRVFMPNGVEFRGWLPGIGLNPSTGAGAFPDLGINGAVQRAVVCILTIDDFVGVWRYTTTWNNGPWFGTGGILDAVAHTHPDSSNVLLLTMRPNSWTYYNGWNQTIRIMFDFETFTWVFPRQRVIDRVSATDPENWPWSWPWNAAWTFVEIWGSPAAGVMIPSSCNVPFFPALTFTANVTQAGAGWGGVVHTFTKIDPATLPPPLPPDFSVDVEGTGLFVVGTSGTYLAEADVTLGESVDSAIIVVVSGDIQSGDIAGLKQDIANGTITGVRLTESGVARVPFPVTPPTPGTFSFFVVTFGDNDVQEYDYYTFVFPTPTPPPPPDPDPTP